MTHAFGVGTEFYFRRILLVWRNLLSWVTFFLIATHFLTEWLFSLICKVYIFWVHNGSICFFRSIYFQIWHPFQCSLN